MSPVLECVVFKDGSPDVAYWGYLNNRDGVAVRAPGRRRTGSRPPPPSRSARRLRAGAGRGVFQTPFQAGSTTLVWTLTGQTATASAELPACNPTVELRKVVEPADDPGVFQLRINERGRGDGRQRDDERPTRRRRR